MGNIPIGRITDSLVVTIGDEVRWDLERRGEMRYYSNAFVLGRLKDEEENTSLW
jgi:hypothetical protein